MNKKTLDEKIKIAKDLVKGMDEKFEVAAFSAVLIKLLDEEKKGDDIKKLIETKARNISQVVEVQNKKEEFARNCDISSEELDKVLYIKDDYVQLLKIIKKGEAEKQRIASKCILTAFLDAYQKDWIDSEILINSLEKSGVSLNKLARNIRQESVSFSIRGHGKGNKLQYAITGPAKVDAYGIIKKLAKGENLE